MTITSKDLSGAEAYTGVARTEHENKQKKIDELQAMIDKLKFKNVKKKSKQKKNK